MVGSKFYEPSIFLEEKAHKNRTMQKRLRCLEHPVDDLVNKLSLSELHVLWLEAWAKQEPTYEIPSEPLPILHGLLKKREEVRVLCLVRLWQTPINRDLLNGMVWFFQGVFLLQNQFNREFVCVIDTTMKQAPSEWFWELVDQMIKTERSDRTTWISTFTADAYRILAPDDKPLPGIIDHLPGSFLINTLKPFLKKDGVKFFEDAPYAAKNLTRWYLLKIPDDVCRLFWKKPYREHLLQLHPDWFTSEFRKSKWEEKKLSIKTEKVSAKSFARWLLWAGFYDEPWLHQELDQLEKVVDNQTVLKEEILNHGFNKKGRSWVIMKHFDWIRCASDALTVFLEDQEALKNWMKDKEDNDWIDLAHCIDRGINEPKDFDPYIIRRILEVFYKHHQKLPKFIYRYPSETKLALIEFGWVHNVNEVAGITEDLLDTTHPWFNDWLNSKDDPELWCGFVEKLSITDLPPDTQRKAIDIYRRRRGCIPDPDYLPTLTENNYQALGILPDDVYADGDPVLWDFCSLALLIRIKKEHPKLPNMSTMRIFEKLHSNEDEEAKITAYDIFHQEILDFAKVWGIDWEEIVDIDCGWSTQRRKPEVLLLKMLKDSSELKYIKVLQWCIKNQVVCRRRDDAGDTAYDYIIRGWSYSQDLELNAYLAGFIGPYQIRTTDFYLYRMVCIIEQLKEKGINNIGLINKILVMSGDGEVRSLESILEEKLNVDRQQQKEQARNCDNLQVVTRIPH